MRDIPSYVTEERLFGRHGFKGLDFHGRGLLLGVDPRGRHVLEVGAGDGIMSLWLLHAGAASVTSLEPEHDGATDGVLDRARRHRSAVGLTDERLELRAERFQDHQPTRKYDLVLLRNSVNHLDEPATEKLLDDPEARATYRAIFRMAHDMMAPGGYIVMADSARINLWDQLGVTPPLAPTIEWHKHQEPETWAEVLAEAGFETTQSKWWWPTYTGRFAAPLFDTRFVQRLMGSYFVLVARRR